MLKSSTTSIYNFQELTKKFKVRQFEYHLSQELLVFGTLKGNVCVIDLEKRDTQNSVYFIGNHGGLTWLNKYPTKFISGSASGKLICGDISDSYNSIIQTEHVNNVLTSSSFCPSPYDQSSRTVKEYESFDQLTSVHVNSTSQYLLVGGYSKNIRLYDIETQQITHDYIDAHNDHINISRFAHHHPSIFLTSSFDKTAKAWDIRMGNKAKPIYTIQSRTGIVMINFSPDDTFLLCSAHDNEITQFLSIDGTKHTVFDIPKTGLKSNFTRAYYTASGSYIVTGACEECAVSVLSTNTGTLLTRFDMYPNRRLPSLYVQSLRCHPQKDGEFCVIANYKDFPNRDLVKINLPLFNSRFSHNDNDYGVYSNCKTDDSSCIPINETNSNSNSLSLDDSLLKTTNTSNSNINGIYDTREYEFVDPLYQYFCYPTPALRQSLQYLHQEANIFANTLTIATHSISSNATLVNSTVLFAESHSMDMEVNDSSNYENPSTQKSLTISTNQFQFALMVCHVDCNVNISSNTNIHNHNVEKCLYTIHSCIVSSRCPVIEKLVNSTVNPHKKVMMNASKYMCLPIYDISNLIFPSTTSSTNNHNQMLSSCLYDYGCDIFPLILKYLYEDLATVGQPYRRCSTNNTHNHDHNKTTTNFSSNIDDTTQSNIKCMLDSFANTETENYEGLGLCLNSVREMCLRHFINQYSNNMVKNNNTKEHENESKKWLNEFITKLSNNDDDVIELATDEILWRSNIFLSLFLVDFIHHLLHAAKLFELDGLYKACIGFLTKCVYNHTVNRILFICGQYDLIDCQSYVLHYLTNHMDLVKAINIQFPGTEISNKSSYNIINHRNTTSIDELRKQYRNSISEHYIQSKNHKNRSVTNEKPPKFRGSIWNNAEIDNLGYLSEDDEENIIMTHYHNNDERNNNHNNNTNKEDNKKLKSASIVDNILRLNTSIFGNSKLITNSVATNKMKKATSFSSELTKSMNGSENKRPSLPVFLYHTCVGLLDHLIMVLGGREMFSVHSSSSLFIFNTQTHHWSRVSTSTVGYAHDSIPECLLMHQSCSMTPKPPSLSPFATDQKNSNDHDTKAFNHSVNSVNDKCTRSRHPSRYIAVVGGQQSLNIAASYPTATTPSLVNLNKRYSTVQWVYLLDALTLTWYRPVISIKAPSNTNGTGRHSSSQVAYDDILRYDGEFLNRSKFSMVSYCPTETESEFESYFDDQHIIDVLNTNEDIHDKDSTNIWMTSCEPSMAMLSLIKHKLDLKKHDKFIHTTDESMSNREIELKMIEKQKLENEYWRYEFTRHNIHTSTTSTPSTKSNDDTNTNTNRKDNTKLSTMQYHETWMFILGGYYKTQSMLTNDLKVIVCSKPIIKVYKHSNQQNQNGKNKPKPNHSNDNSQNKSEIQNETENEKYNNISYEYADPCTWKWELHTPYIAPHLSEHRPEPLCNHVAAILHLPSIQGGARMIAIAQANNDSGPDVYSLKCSDLNNLEWENIHHTINPSNHNNWPTSISGHTLTELNNNDYTSLLNNKIYNENEIMPSARMILIGGISQEEIDINGNVGLKPSSDIWFLNIYINELDQALSYQWQMIHTVTVAATSEEQSLLSASSLSCNTTTVSTTVSNHNTTVPHAKKRQNLHTLKNSCKIRLSGHQTINNRGFLYCIGGSTYHPNHESVERVNVNVLYPDVLCSRYPSKDMNLCMCESFTKNLMKFQSNAEISRLTALYGCVPNFWIGSWLSYCPSDINCIDDTFKVFNFIQHQYIIEPYCTNLSLCDIPNTIQFDMERLFVYGNLYMKAEIDGDTHNIYDERLFYPDIEFHIHELNSNNFHNIDYSNENISMEQTSNCENLITDNTTSVSHPCSYTKYYAHACILKNRCNILKAMLSGSMKEARSRVIDIYDYKATVFKAFLCYLYTDTLRVEPDDVLSLCQLAAQYNLERLERLCEGYLSIHVDHSNNLDLIQYADYLHLDCLKKTCLSMILYKRFYSNNTDNTIKKDYEGNDDNCETDDGIYHDNNNKIINNNLSNDYSKDENNMILQLESLATKTNNEILNTMLNEFCSTRQHIYIVDWLQEKAN